VTKPAPVLPIVPVLDVTGLSCQESGAQAFDLIASSAPLPATDRLEMVDTTTGQVVARGHQCQDVLVYGPATEPVGASVRYVARLVNATDPALDRNSTVQTVTNHCPVPHPPLSLVIAGQACAPNGSQLLTFMASDPTVGRTDYIEVVNNTTTGHVVAQGGMGITQVTDAAVMQPTGVSDRYAARLVDTAHAAFDAQTTPSAVANPCAPLPNPPMSPLALILPPYNPDGAQTYPIVRVPMVDEGQYPTYDWKPYSAAHVCNVQKISEYASE